MPVNTKEYCATYCTTGNLFKDRVGALPKSPCTLDPNSAAPSHPPTVPIERESSWFSPQALLTNPQEQTAVIVNPAFVTCRKNSRSLLIFLLLLPGESYPHINTTPRIWWQKSVFHQFMVRKTPSLKHWLWMQRQLLSCGVISCWNYSPTFSTIQKWLCVSRSTPHSQGIFVILQLLHLNRV